MPPLQQRRIKTDPEDSCTLNSVIAGLDPAIHAVTAKKLAPLFGA